MEAITQIIDMIPDVLNALLVILGLFSIIAKLTPSTWDDKLIVKLVNLIGLAKKK